MNGVRTMRSKPLDEQAIPEQPLGRRERGKRDKRRRISEAAAALFAERGYAAVTTHEIAEAADVGTGTLFRHFRSKADLLVAVGNERLRAGTTGGVEAARAGAAPADAIMAVLAPLADIGLGQPENAVVYQRETLFGEGDAAAAAAAEVARIEDAIHEILVLHVARTPDARAVDLREAAHAIYATMYMDLVRVSVGRAPAVHLPARLRRSVEFLLDGLLGTGAGSGQPGA